jgi:hypothetical protein
MRKVLVLGVLLLAACTDPDGATRALRDQGFKNIEITGYQFVGCDDKDTFHTGFKATTVNGVPTIGVVCSGLMKGSTVRFQ